MDRGGVGGSAAAPAEAAAMVDRNGGRVLAATAKNFANRFGTVLELCMALILVAEMIATPALHRG